MQCTKNCSLTRKLRRRGILFSERWKRERIFAKEDAFIRCVNWDVHVRYLVESGSGHERVWPSSPAKLASDFLALSLNFSVIFSLFPHQIIAVKRRQTKSRHSFLLSLVIILLFFEDGAIISRFDDSAKLADDESIRGHVLVMPSMYPLCVRSMEHPACTKKERLRRRIWNSLPFSFVSVLLRQQQCLLFSRFCKVLALRWWWPAWNLNPVRYSTDISTKRELYQQIFHSKSSLFVSFVFSKSNTDWVRQNCKEGKDTNFSVCCSGGY